MSTVDGIGQEPKTPPQPPLSDRPIWLAIILITAVLVGAGAGGLFHLTGASAADVLTAASAAFGGTVALSFAVWKFLTSRS